MKTRTPKAGSPATLARRYLKLVEWSEKDGCFVGSAPQIIGPCCHGATEAKVMAQLTLIVEKWIEIILKDGDRLPAGTAAS